MSTDASPEHSRIPSGPLTPAPIVVMGVSGVGKSSVGSALASLLKVRFVDADSLHPLANVQKMAGGISLTDEDRWPWLRVVGLALASASTEGIVVACSALRRAYRDEIRRQEPGTLFIFLEADGTLLRERLTQRPGHFMPASLLDSQLETLEPLESDEAGLTIASAGGIDATAREVFHRLAGPLFKA
ncbi:gluconokinase [Arthrobacter sp. 135MFCol5.1]|uniref:gluconokinase n=1 Tax=Arthrobacter sp. 135MFCol5.1 TaxID=1158050 RepID=UPI0003751D59|nr:gluconokinase [Arthrobacter sp. 135MFCol5.1]